MDNDVVDDSSLLINVKSDRYPMTLDDVREEVPQVSLPLTPGTRQLSRLGYEVVKVVKKPDDETMVEGFPVKGDDGDYRQHWRLPNDKESEGILQEKKNESLRHLKRQYQHLTNVGFAFFIEGTQHHIPVTTQNRQYLLETQVVMSFDEPLEKILIPTKKTTYEAVDRDQARDIVQDFLVFCNRLETAFLTLKKLTLDAKEMSLIPAIFDVTLEHEVSRAH